MGQKHIQKLYNNDFERLLSCYVESGIPLIVSLDDFDEEDGNGIGHALLCIGYENITSEQVCGMLPTEITTYNLKEEAERKRIRFYDCHNIPKKFVFVDDNHPVYQHASLSEPAKHYP